MKTEKYTTDGFMNRLKIFLPMFIVIMYMTPLTRLVLSLVGEKESKIRESMKIMGLKDRDYWLSWIIQYFVIAFVISCITTLLARIKLF